MHYNSSIITNWRQQNPQKYGKVTQDLQENIKRIEQKLKDMESF